MKDDKELHQVYSVHDPRLDPQRSCVYVGMTARSDIGPSIRVLMKKPLATLQAELRQRGLKPEIRLWTPRLPRNDALDLREDLREMAVASGSLARKGRNGRVAAFTVTEVPYDSAGLVFGMTSPTVR